jgi:RHS repeat-associated protein
MRRQIAIASALYCVLWTGSAWAAGDVFDQFFRYVEVKNRVIEPHLPGETIDHFTGNLTVVHEDMSFPGIAGLDLQIIRTYSSKIWGRSDLLDSEPLLADKEQSPVGFGWSMHMGRVRAPVGQNPVYQAPDGSSHVFYLAGGANTDFISRDSWKYSRNWQQCANVSSGQGVCITTTSGMRLEFAASNQYFVGSTPVWPLSAVVDVFGNRILVTYQPGGSTFGGSTGRIDHITDTYNRVVTFNYQSPQSCGSSNCLSSIVASPASGGGSRQVSYTYVMSSGQGGANHYPLPTPGRAFLTAVQPAMGAGYRYDYGYANSVANNQYALTSITYPYGGTTTYAYGTKSFFTSCDNVPMAVVTSRTTSGRGLPTANWTYDYVSPSSSGSYQTLTETRPDNKKNIYEFYGFGYAAGIQATGSVWRVGLLYRTTRDASSPGAGAEVETTDWDQGTTVAQAQKIYQAPIYSTACPNWAWDNTVQAPVMKTRTIARSSSSYVTTLSGHDQYGQPGTVSETGDGAAGRSTTYQYNYDTVNYQVVGRISSEKVCEGSDCYQNTRTFTATPKNRLGSQTLKGITTNFTYYSNGDLHTVFATIANVDKTMTLQTYSNGLPTIIDFKGAFLITRVVNWDGSVASETNGRGNITQYKYDLAGRLHLVTPPAGNDQQTYCYNLQPATGTSPAYEDSYSIRRTTYSPSANPDTICALNSSSIPYWETTKWDGRARVVGTENSLGEKQTREFNNLDQLIFNSYPWGNGVPEVGEQFDYESLGRRTMTRRRYLPTQHLPLVGQCSDPSSCQLAIVYNDASHYQHITVDRAANDSTTSDNYFVSFGTPSEERLVTVTDALSHKWTYDYDVAGNLKTFTAPSAGGDRSFTYDPQTFLVKTDTSGPRGTISITQYNEIGQPHTRIDARAVTTTFTYDDPLSRLTKTEYSISNGQEDTSRTYDYDLLHTVSSPNGGTYTYGYDELSRLTSQSWAYRGQTYQTTYYFDSTGCLQTMTYPTRTVLTMACDAKGRVKSITLSGTTSGTIVNDVSYHPGGRPTSITYGNGLSATTVVENGRVRSITTPNIVSLAYIYDGANNVKTITDGIVQGNTASMITYDKFDRLFDVTTSSGTFSYRYDDLGNRKQITAPNVGVTTFSYDPNTNRLSGSSGPSAPRAGKLWWNAAGRLQAGFDGASYAYDGFGRRTAKHIPPSISAPPGVHPAGGITRHPAVDVVYHYDSGGRLLAETLQDGTKIREYYYVAGQLVAVDGCISGYSTGCGEREWYHTDLLGSAVARTNAKQTVTARVAYQPWGEVPAPGMGAPGTRLYNGKPRDDGTGFYDYGARVYSLELGRFMSADPGWSARDNPESSNLYAYTLNNPYKYIDPTGKIPFLAVTAAAGALIGAGIAITATYDSPTGIDWDLVGVSALAGGAAGLGSAQQPALTSPDQLLLASARLQKGLRCGAQQCLDWGVRPLRTTAKSFNVMLRSSTKAICKAVRLAQ